METTHDNDTTARKHTAKRLRRVRPVQPRRPGVRTAPHSGATTGRPQSWPTGLQIGDRIDVRTKQGAFTGRVRTLTAELLRLQDGAGMWDIRPGDVMAMTTTGHAPFVPPVLASDEHARLANRMLSRWQ
jgi:hypothetical protein